MAAANLDPSPGAGSKQATDKDLALYASTLRALDELANALPGFITRLKSKTDLDARQQALAQSGGSIEQTGSGGDQVQLRVSERIGEGTFCVVYKAELLPRRPGGTHTREVALKFELRKTDPTQLRNEFRMYKKVQACPGVANIYFFGEMDLHKVLVMDLLGPSLESYLQHCGRHFSVKTVCMLAIQMISRVQAIHEQNLIYRDIKPENFLMGLPSSPNADTVHLIDYGMAKAFRDSETNKHIPYGESHSLSGTARYMSINAHRRCTQSRRDDLEALGHVFLYFLRGNLPWQGVKAPQNDQRYDQMCEKKQATSIEALCKGYPPEFAEYLTYTRSLAFDGDPDYDYLRSLFTKTLDALGAVNDNVYDWSTTAPKEGNEGTPSVFKTTTVSPVTTITPSKSESPLPQRATQSDGLAQAARPVIPQHATHQPRTGIVPPGSSPPGAKRSRSEFVSELRPPTRKGPKKSMRTFYDSEAQRSLVTLYREVMANRYAFHRAVKQSRSAVESAITATVAASDASVARPSTVRASYTRTRAPARAMGPAVISQSFSDDLDKTLAKVINELEEMSDKLLKDGDWSGAPRVQAWLEEADAAVRNEMQRLRLEMDKVREKMGPREGEDLPSSPTTAESTSTAFARPSALRQAGERHGQRPGGRVLIDVDQITSRGVDGQPLTRSMTPAHREHFQQQINMTPLEALEVDENPEVDDFVLPGMNLGARYGGRRGSGYAKGGSVPVSAPSPAVTHPADARPSAAVPIGIGSLSIAGDPIEIADRLDVDDGDSDDNEPLELVYRTASGTRKVMRLPHYG